MRRTTIALIATIGLCGSLRVPGGAQGAGAEGTPPGVERPNILYIFTDDQSIRTVGCYPEAHPWVKTPNIDSLAREGVRFTHCYTGAWCMPSRATALTGRLQHGVASLRMVGPYPGCTYDPQACPFWPSVFRKHGYHTGIIGKWHTGPDHGHGRDWDYSAIWDHTQAEYGHYYSHQKISFNGAAPKDVGGYSTDNYTRYAVDFISERARTKAQPWYLWLCYDAVHSPYASAERHRNDYRNTPRVPVPDDIYPPRPTKPKYMQNYGLWKKDDSGEPAIKGRTLTHFVQQYNRAVRAVDEGVGEVLKVLKATGQLENTVVVFTSDQGFAWGQHGFQWKYAPYDANLRAPLVVRYPKRIPQAAVCRHPVGGHDLIPTFFALAGIDLPWKMHGRDLTPLLRDPGAEWNEPVMLENTKWFYGADTDPGSGPGWNGVPWWVFLRQGKYKYIRTLVEGEIEELYDLEADPEELVNLALTAQHQGTLASYRRKLLDELKRTDAGMAKNLPGAAGVSQ